MRINKNINKYIINTEEFHKYIINNIKIIDIIIMNKKLLSENSKPKIGEFLK